ncbi:MAG TPA: hypothetical protein VGF86_14475 [Candidatus Tumulicola sp.]
MNETESAAAKHLASVTEELPAIVNRLSAKHGKPAFIEDGVDSRFLYEKPTWVTYQLAKAVRLVSAIRAALILLQYGHTVEANALLRIIADSIADTIFAQDAIKAGLNNAEQERDSTQFFEDFKDHPRLQYAGTFKMHRAERKTIQAAQGRYFDESDPHRPRMLAAAIDHVLSGYIHGSYSTAMEMYAGGRDEFDMQGMLGSTRVAESLQALSYYVEMALGALILLAINLRDHESLGRLTGLKDSFPTA